MKLDLKEAIELYESSKFTGGFDVLNNNYIISIPLGKREKYNFFDDEGTYIGDSTIEVETVSVSKDDNGEYQMNVLVDDDLKKTDLVKRRIFQVLSKIGQSTYPEDYLEEKEELAYLVTNLIEIITRLDQFASDD